MKAGRRISAMNPIGARQKLAYLTAKITARFNYVVTRIPYIASLPDAPDVPADMRAVTAAAEQAFDRYEPQAGMTTITYFHPAIRDFANLLDFASEWRRKAGAGIETVAVPGDHFTMLEAPAVDVMAEKIRERLIRLGR
jgi:thioesterase domain-containing protein